MAGKRTGKITALLEELLLEWEKVILKFTARGSDQKKYMCFVFVPQQAQNLQ